LFNIKELSTDRLLNADENGEGLDKQLRAAAQIIQKINPDILIINELDHDYNSIDKGLSVNSVRFQDSYLNRGRAGISYPYLFVAPCNTGIPTGLDLNKDGIISGDQNVGSRDYGTDCFGFGNHPGQYAMSLFSMYPIDTNQVRTFQKFLWKDLPGNHIPLDFYDDEALNIFRLSSKSHWDVPIIIKGKKFHLFLSHPTPPTFDGDEDRNGRRNFDEIKFWAHYLDADQYLYDDMNISGGFKGGNSFLIAGDLNASWKSDSRYDEMVAIDQLLNHPKISDTGKWLVSRGGWEGRKEGPPDYWERSTAKFGQDYRMRIDYLLPGKDIQIIDGGVYWPSSDEDTDGHHLAEIASDHRLVWLDIVLP
jgi:3-phytase